MPLTIRSVPHPLLEAGAFVARLHQALTQIPSPRPDAPAPLTGSDTVKTAVRDLLRHGGFKPSGRSKPASEYLASAFADGRWPQINALVDACNVVSLHAGLPISLVDLDKVTGALAIEVAPPGTSYVFNPSGQVIDASGLVCLCDEQGPTGTPVKDAQRTKTDADTKNVLVIVWGTNALPGRTDETTRWYRALLTPYAVIEDVAIDT
ncbi:MAG TPA: phenylalanine--tRNA ligase beta subunit-related protein [Kofleriaceae bacterium]|nr:phenylalanine--tRNA ligase beta subunit-related protein [Kofleriaceae bacterium]